MKIQINFTLLLLFFLNMSLTAQSNVKEALKRKYDTVTMQSGWYSVTLNGKKGACDLKGRKIVPCKYDNVVLHSGWYSVKLEGKEGACDLAGNELIPCEYDNIFLNENWYSVKLNGKEGACNLKGEKIIPCNYESLIFTEGKYKYKANDKWLEIGTSIDTNEKYFFEGKSYQLQNTNNISVSQVFSFEKDNKFTYSNYNNKTKKESKKKGVYKYDNGKLRIDFDDHVWVIYNLTQISELKINLTNKNENLILAQLLSSEDGFYRKTIYNQLNNSGENNSNKPAAKMKICPSCEGTRKSSGYNIVAGNGSSQKHWCKICKMNVSATHGEHHKCSVCKGTGTVESH